LCIFNYKTCRVEVNGVFDMKVLTTGHKYELANFESTEVNNVDVYGYQTIQFIEKKTVTQMRLDGQMPPDHLLGGDKLDELVTVNNGTTNEEVLEMLIDRMKYLQAKFPCKENACCITHLEEGLMWLEKRTKDRVKREVEGKAIA
jgi:hypothetical protein